MLSALLPDGAGHRVLAARARATVAVVGLGRVGAALAVHLATAGVGALVLDDPGTVLTTDVGGGAYRLRDVGSPREGAVRRIVEEVAPGVVTASTPVTPEEARAPRPTSSSWSSTEPRTRSGSGGWWVRGSRTCRSWCARPTSWSGRSSGRGSTRA